MPRFNDPSQLYYVKLITGDNIFSYIEESENDPMELVFIQPAFMHMVTTEVENENKEKDTKLEYIILGWLPTGKTDADRVDILREHMLYATPLTVEYADTLIPFIEKVYLKTSKEPSLGEISAMLEKFKKKGGNA